MAPWNSGTLHRPVAVIGGGFAGLAAATALTEAGVPVHVVEARPTLGGRANAFRDPITGERIDNGQHVLAGCYTETLGFLTRIGTATRLHRPSTLRVPMIDEDGSRTELVLPALPSPLDLVAAVFAWEALTLADRWSLLRLGTALRGDPTIGAHETVRQWLERRHQSPRLCRLFWEPLALAALNQSIDAASAESFVAVTSRMFAPVPEAATLLVPSVPLDELYAIPAKGFLERAGSAVTTHAKAHVVFDRGRVAGVQTHEAFVAASQVISAVPWFALADTLPQAPESLAHIIANARELGSAPIVTVNLWFEGYAPSDTMLGLPGRTFQWIFDRRRLVGHSQTHLSLVSSGAEHVCDRTNDELISIAVSELRAAIAELRTAALRHASVVRERRATFSLKPGSPPRPATATPVAGLLLAGDWIDTGLPATIESAVVAGHRAASAALTCLRS